METEALLKLFRTFRFQSQCNSCAAVSPRDFFNLKSGPSCAVARAIICNDSIGLMSSMARLQWLSHSVLSQAPLPEMFNEYFTIHASLLSINPSIFFYQSNYHHKLSSGSCPFNRGSSHTVLAYVHATVHPGSTLLKCFPNSQQWRPGHCCIGMHLKFNLLFTIPVAHGHILRQCEMEECRLTATCCVHDSSRDTTVVFME